MIGSTLGTPQAATLTSTGGTVVITNGPNSINLETGSAIALDFDADSGSATPAAGTIIMAGGTGITTSAAGNTVTFDLDTPVTLANGGTSASLVASNGGIFYSTAAAGAILSGTATATQMLQSGASAAPAWSTSTWPATTTINQLLYSSAANTVAGLATANQGVLTTGATGIPVITALATDGQLIIGSTAGVPAAATLTPGSGIGIANGSNSITISASASTPLSFPTDSGTATPAANALTIAGGTGIDTTGAGATVTVTFDVTEVAAIATSYNGNSGTATPAANVLTVSGSGGITVTGSGSTLTVAGTGVSNWAVETGATRSLTVNQGVVGNRGTGQTFTLPSSAAVGDIIRVAQVGAGAVTIAQNASQQIRIGSSATTVGAGGSLASTAQGSSLEILCWATNNDWVVLDSMGSWTVV